MLQGLPGRQEQTTFCFRKITDAHGKVQAWLAPSLQSQISSWVPGLMLNPGSSRHLPDCGLTSAPSDCGFQTGAPVPLHMYKSTSVPFAVAATGHVEALAECLEVPGAVGVPVITPAAEIDVPAGSPLAARKRRPPHDCHPCRQRCRPDHDPGKVRWQYGDYSWLSGRPAPLGGCPGRMKQVNAGNVLSREQRGQGLGAPRSAGHGDRMERNRHPVLPIARSCAILLMTTLSADRTRCGRQTAAAPSPPLASGTGSR
jgi:hypothetical protein